MDKVAQYFSGISHGDGINGLNTLRQNLEIVFKHYPAPNLIRAFWMASHAGAFGSDINPYAKLCQTKIANNILNEKLKDVERVIDDPAVDAEDLVRLLQTYIFLQTIPQQSVLKKILDKCANSFQQTDVHASIKIVKQLAEIGVYPGDEWIEKWWDSVSLKLGKVSIPDGCKLLYRITLLDFLRSKDASVKREKTSPCKTIAESFLNVLEKCAKILFPGKLDRNIFFAAEWFGRDFVNRFQIESETHSFSMAEAHFADNFSGTKIIVNPEGIKIPQNGHRIDLELINGKTHGAELDGITHLNRAQMSGAFRQAVAYNTSTRFQSWLIAKLCPELCVLRIPFFYTGHEAMQREPWEEAFLKLDQKKPGVYAYHGNGHIKNMADRNGFLYRDRALFHI